MKMSIFDIIMWVCMGMIIGAFVAGLFMEKIYKGQIDDINSMFFDILENMSNDLPDIGAYQNNSSANATGCACVCLDSGPSFMKAVEDITDHDYVPDVYDCTEFSTDLVMALRDDGWKARQVTGYYYGNNGTSCGPEEERRYDCRHSWVIVEVPVEATGGWIIEPGIYDKYYS